MFFERTIQNQNLQTVNYGQFLNNSNIFCYQMGIFLKITFENPE